MSGSRFVQSESSGAFRAASTVPPGMSVGDSATLRCLEFLDSIGAHVGAATRSEIKKQTKERAAK